MTSVVEALSESLGHRHCSGRAVRKPLFDVKPLRQLIKGDKRNGLCGYCRRGLAPANLSDVRTHYRCPVDSKPWMGGEGL